MAAAHSPRLGGGAAALALLCVAGCGAKTGLEVPPPPPWEPADDAGAFPGLPPSCALDLPEVPAPTAPRAIDGGQFFTMAVRADGRVFVWGLLADGPPAIEAAGPTRVALLSEARSVSASGAVACVLTVAGDVWCSTPGDRRELHHVELEGPATVVAAASTSCAIVTGRVYCWNARDRVARLVAASANARDLASGTDGACAVTGSGRVLCWAHATSDRERAAELDVPCAREVSIGGLHACARTSSGDVWCWGDNRSAQLGQGDTAPHEGVVRVRAPPAVELASWTRGTCLRAADGTVWCWGEDLDIDGVGTRTPTGPLQIPGVLGAAAIGAGGQQTRATLGSTTVSIRSIDHRCAAQWDDRFTCWGNNTNAELGRRGPSDSIVSARLE